MWVYYFTCDMCWRGRDDIDKTPSGTVIVILNNIHPELKVTLNIVVVRPSFQTRCLFIRWVTLYFFTLAMRYKQAWKNDLLIIKWTNAIVFENRFIIEGMDIKRNKYILSVIIIIILNSNRMNIKIEFLLLIVFHISQTL